MLPKARLGLRGGPGELVLILGEQKVLEGSGLPPILAGTAEQNSQGGTKAEPCGAPCRTAELPSARPGVPAGIKELSLGAWHSRAALCSPDTGSWEGILPGRVRRPWNRVPRATLAVSQARMDIEG